MAGLIFGALMISLIYIVAVLARLYFNKEGLLNEYPYNVKKAYMGMHPEFVEEKLEKLKYHKIAGLIVVTIALGILAYMAGCRNDSVFHYILTVLSIYLMWAIVFGFHTGVVNYLIFEKMEFARLPYTEEMDKEYESDHIKIKTDLKKWAIVGVPISILASFIVFLL